MGTDSILLGSWTERGLPSRREGQGSSLSNLIPTWPSTAHQAVPVAVQAAHGSHHPVSEGLGDQQTKLHAAALHQPAPGHGAPGQPRPGPQLQERRLHAGIAGRLVGSPLIAGAVSRGHCGLQCGCFPVKSPRLCGAGPVHSVVTRILPGQTLGCSCKACHPACELCAELSWAPCVLSRVWESKRITS